MQAYNERDCQNVTILLRELRMTYWSKIRSKKAVLLSLMILTALFFAFPAFAGWNVANRKNVTYTDPSGVPVTGLHTIEGRTYYFNARGILQTGWVQMPEGIRYFQPVGRAGAALGAMVSGGVVRINKATYGFDENGLLLTGFQTFETGSYFFRLGGKPGVRGMAITGKFRNLPDGRRAYFLPNGLMAVNRWVNGHKSFVDETGNMIRSTITDDGYVIKANGKVKKKLKKSAFARVGGNWYFFRKGQGLLKSQVFVFKGSRYYVDEDGIRQTGWISWEGHEYYFEADGKAATGQKTIDGEVYSFNEEGQLDGSDIATGTMSTTGKASILILCGHGQGDSGAVGCNGTYKEANCTRDFGKRIYDALLNTNSVNVQLFNTNYDMYQQMKATVGSVGSFSGNGNKRRKVLAAVRKNSKIPDVTKFDFVLEVHFNATGTNAKDPGGDGSKKGTGTYVNSHKSAANRKIDRKIISALNGVGLNTWGSGVYGSPDLLNAKVFTELGINYTLLETCFIDDKDDMKFYMRNRDDMAEAVANAIVGYFK